MRNEYTAQIGSGLTVANKSNGLSKRSFMRMIPFYLGLEDNHFIGGQCKLYNGERYWSCAIWIPDANLGEGDILSCYSYGDGWHCKF